MDPLSVTASVIAIVEAVGSIGTVIKTVRSLGNASAEFLALLNELSLMQVVLEQVKSSLETVEKLPTNTGTNNINLVKVHEQELAQISADLTGLAEKFITGIKGRDRKGLPRISKVQWYQEKSNIIRLRERAQDIHKRLSHAFTTINSSQIALQTRLIIDIQDIVETKWTSIEQNVDNGITDLRLCQTTLRDTQTTMHTDIETVKQRTEHIHAIKDGLDDLKQMIEALGSNSLQDDQSVSRRQAHQRWSTWQGYDGLTDSAGHEQVNSSNDQGCRDNGLSSASIMGSDTLETQATEALTRSASHSNPTDIPTSAVAVSGTIRQRCPPQCKCQCHRISRVQTPKFLRSVIGALCVQYNSIPFFDRRPCNSSLCQSNSRIVIRVQYQFPSWMVARAVCALVSSHGLTDAGASMHLKVPRVINDPSLYWAVYLGDLQWLKHQISMKRLSKTDIDVNGGCLITMAFDYGRLDVAQFLLEAGFDYSIQSANGRLVSPITSSHNFKSTIHCVNYVWFTITNTYLFLYLKSSESTQVTYIVLICPKRSPIQFMRYRVASNSVTPSLLTKLQVHLPKLLDEEEEYELRSTTIIHDAVLGTTKTTLRDALEMDPSKKDTLDYMGFPPLLWAVARRDQKAVNELLSLGASVDVSSPTAGTPLHMACRSGSVTLASMLIDAGADVNARDCEGRTLLHLGVYSPSTTVLLLQHGANPHARDNKGNSPLHVHDIVALAQIDDIYTSFAALVGAGVDLESTNKAGETPLHTAAIFSPAATMCLIDLGAKVDALNLFGQGLLHLVALYWNFEHIESLRNAKIGPIDTEVVTKSGHTPLMVMWSRVMTKDDHNFALRARCPTLGLVWSFTALIVDVREQSWEAGLFLESRERVTADFSHQKMLRWLARQWERMQKDDSLRGQIWSESDGWWFDEDLNEEEWSEDLEYDEEWLDDKELDDEFEEDRVTRITAGSDSDHYEPGALSNDGSEEEDADGFFDAQEHPDRPTEAT